MKTSRAILLTVGLLAAGALLTWLVGLHLFWLIMLGTSFWVAVDSDRINLSRYESGISYQPVILGLLCTMFWIVAFPWYLSQRHKIMSGTARLRGQHKPWPLSDGQMGPNGLIQPWRGRKL